MWPQCEEGELDASVACKHTELRKVHGSAQGREWWQECGWVGVRGWDQQHNDSGLLYTMDSFSGSPYLRLRSVLDDRQVVEDGPAAQGRRVLVGDGGVLTACVVMCKAPSQVKSTASFIN